MTKSEARAIEEMCNRALRVLNDPHPNAATREERLAAFERIKPAVDEIERVRAMANAEIG
jgi:hypothetical protein